MVFMVLIGRSKFGQNNRISLVEGLPDVKYSGFDFEGDEIHENLLKLEKSKTDELEDANLDPEEIEERARQSYLKDKAEREKKKS